jgi:hypothetical protein
MKFMEGSSTPNSSPRSYLSKEAQQKIAQICSGHGLADEDEGEKELDARDSLVSFTARCRSTGVILDKRPFPELVSVPVSERRELAPHISTIYDQARCFIVFESSLCIILFVSLFE